MQSDDERNLNLLLVTVDLHYKRSIILMFDCIGYMPSRRTFHVNKSKLSDHPRGFEVKKKTNCAFPKDEPFKYREQRCGANSP